VREQIKKIKKFWHIIPILISVLTIFLAPIITLYPTPAEAETTDYNWVDHNTIHSTPKDIDYKWIKPDDPKVTAVAQFGTGTGCPRGGLSDCEYYLSTKTENDIHYGILSVRIDSRKEARHDLIILNDINKSTWNPVMGGDDWVNIGNLPAGPPIRKQLQGLTLGGHLVPIKPDTWKNKPETVLTNQMSITVTLGGAELGTADVDINKDYYWEFDIKGTYPGTKLFFYEGTQYTVKYFGEDPASNCSGEAGGSSLSGFCTITWKGETTFTVSADSNGVGKITIDKTTAPTLKVGDTFSFGGNITGLDIGITEKVGSPLDGIMENAMAAVLGAIGKGIQVIGGYINGVLNYGNDINSAALGAVWTRVKNLSLGLLTLGILIIAFANILSIDLEKYGLNRMIPKMVIALVMTYFSFIIIRFLLEVASALQSLALGGTKLDVANLGGGKLSAAFTGDVGSVLNSIPLLIVLFLLGFILMVAMIILCFVLIVRIVVLWFLVAIAPIAFIMMIMPFTENLYQQWWAKFWKWAFMGPAIAFMLYMTNEFLQVGFGTAFAGSATMADADTWIFLMMATAGIFISASLPFTMGGDVYGAIQKGIQKYGKHVPGVKQAKARLDLRRGSKESALKLKAMKAQSKWANRGLPGRIIAGTTKTQAKMLDENLIAATSQEMGMAGLDEKEFLAPLLNHRSDNVARAAARELAKRKRLGAALDSMEDPVAAEKAAARVQSLMGTDGGLNTAVRADNKDALASIYNRTGDAKLLPDALKGISGVPLKDIKGHQIKLIQKLSAKATEANNPGLARSYRDMISNQLNDEEARAGFLRNADDVVKASIGQMMSTDPDFKRSVPVDLAAKLTQTYDTFKNTHPQGKGPLD
jgi:hypothetical protein